MLAAPLRKLKRLHPTMIELVDELPALVMRSIAANTLKTYCLVYDTVGATELLIARSGKGAVTATRSS